MNNSSLKVVLTGGPGVGKTTLLNMLKKQNFQTVPEASTMLIKELLETGQQHPIHSGKLQEFQDMLGQKQLQLEAQIKPGLTTFFDRGIIDGLAYCEIFNLEKHPDVIKAAKKRDYSFIFMLDFLDVFDVNHIRLETTSEATRIHRLIAEKYQEFGYNLISVPTFCVDENGNRLSVEESTLRRADFICKKISTPKKDSSLNFFKKSQAHSQMLA